MRKYGDFVACLGKAEIWRKFLLKNSVITLENFTEYFKLITDLMLRELSIRRK